MSNPKFDERPSIRITNTILEHPKVVGLSDKAFRAFVAALCYCSRQETDGHIAKAAARTWVGPTKVITELVNAGLFELNGNGYLIHDYLKHQRSKAEVDSYRKARSHDGKLGAHMRWHVPQRQLVKDCEFCQQGVTSV